MDTPSETLWEVMETLLHSGSETLAHQTFRWSAEYAFLCGLKNARTPVIITKIEQDFPPLRFHLDTRLERAWETMNQLYARREWLAARARFVDEMNACYLHAIKVSKLGAYEGGKGIWSINKWH